ncbi:hypothetical protein PFISCL1PPCAC_23319 [Pristionchus fissidentatus]|uniref:C2H2-type domain-containing protein n=1 Tax=Pristionchus fissidentatus TaxID=1538716 RepID=A0AAV5WQD1_9BILA|nr:hypothetical protein PFISCL1PPCAC_23319 [Pristionchus fissidentatus]
MCEGIPPQAMSSHQPLPPANNGRPKFNADYIRPKSPITKKPRTPRAVPMVNTQGGSLTVGAMCALRVFSTHVNCPFCRVRQRDYEHLHLHVQFAHGILVKQLVYGCTGCGVRYDKPELLQNHLLNQYRLSRRLCSNTAQVLIKYGNDTGGAVSLKEYTQRFDRVVNRAERAPLIDRQAVAVAVEEEKDVKDIKEEPLGEVKEERFDEEPVVKDEPQTAGYPGDSNGFSVFVEECKTEELDDFNEHGPSSSQY